MPRDTPFGAYNFLVDFGGGESPTSAQGGFSDVSGLGTEITLMEYRQGNDKENRVRKIPALHKASDVTLKRGIMGLTNFWQWVSVTRADPTHKRNVSIARARKSGSERVASSADHSTSGQRLRAKLTVARIVSITSSGVLFSLTRM